MARNALAGEAGRWESKLRDAVRKSEEAQAQLDKLSIEKNFFEREQHSLRSFVLTTATSMLAHVKAGKKKVSRKTLVGWCTPFPWLLLLVFFWQNQPWSRSVLLEWLFSLLLSLLPGAAFVAGCSLGAVRISHCDVVDVVA